MSYFEDLGWYIDKKFALFGNAKGRVVKCITGNKWESPINECGKGKEVKYSGEILSGGKGKEVKQFDYSKKIIGKEVVSKTGCADENKHLQ
ncbi:MAG: hypothetical protein ACOC1K_05965 [Nanoarchaeota archaeon]